MAVMVAGFTCLPEGDLLPSFHECAILSTLSASLSFSTMEFLNTFQDFPVFPHIFPKVCEKKFQQPFVFSMYCLLVKDHHY